MIINKFIIVLCILFIILLLIKINRENFQTTTAQEQEQLFSTTLNYNCNNYTEDVCKVFEDSGLCVYHDKCRPVCRFSALENKEDIEKDSNDDPTTKFNKCVEVCENESKDNSYCNTNQCLDICNQQDYGSKRKLVKYEPRPTDITVDKHYENVVNMVKDLPDDPTHPVFKQIIDPLKEYTLSKMGSNREKELTEKINKLNNVTKILEDLGNVKLETENKASYKFVENMERLINRKRSLNNDLEHHVKAKMIQDKIKQIESLTNNWKRASDGSSKVPSINDVFKSVRCISNGQTLNVEPVIYEDPLEGLFVRRDGEYVIQINGTILFFEQRDITTGEICTQGDNCRYIPTDGFYKVRDKEIQGNNIEETDRNVRKQNEKLNNAGAYFKIKYIKNSDEYNRIIKTAGNFDFDNNDIKYPFYIIQPKNNIARCLNIEKKTAGEIQLTVRPCSNRPSERFEAYTYRAFDEKCKYE